MLSFVTVRQIGFFNAVQSEIKILFSFNKKNYTFTSPLRPSSG
jgi:hypothetical protein